MFYLGTHMVNWLSFSKVPLFVSVRQLRKRKSVHPRASCRWSLDSGGFTELNMYGHWKTSPQQYISECRDLMQEIGSMDWAAPQDWMCEQVVLKKTGKTVEEHQRLTVDNYLFLKKQAPDVPFIPVLQGFTKQEYINCARLYNANGIHLAKERVVGLGSICRRQSTEEAVEIVKTLHDFGYKIHGFGYKTIGLLNSYPFLESSDSLAWSFSARYDDPLPGCSHKNCANCWKYAIKWRKELALKVKAKFGIMTLTKGGTNGAAR